MGTFSKYDSLIASDCPLMSWNHLKFWNYYYSDLKPKLDGLQSPMCPPEQLRFKALELTPKDRVKVVILGQDPYHTPGVANGLAFSCRGDKKIQPSLANIFKEYVDDLGFSYPKSGDLSPWARNGVLLLNTCLSVEVGRPGSHRNIGWERLTYEVLRDLSTTKEALGFIFWGKEAQNLASAVEPDMGHYVHRSAHPSPYSASQGFFGSKPFSKVSRALSLPQSLWRLP